MHFFETVSLLGRDENGPGQTKPSCQISQLFIPTSTSREAETCQVNGVRSLKVEGRLGRELSLENFVTICRHSSATPLRS